jgi:hypothetical protein
VHEPGPPHLTAGTWPGQLADRENQGVHDAEGDRHQQCGDAQAARRAVAQLGRADVQRGHRSQRDRGHRGLDGVCTGGGDGCFPAGGRAAGDRGAQGHRDDDSQQEAQRYQCHDGLHSGIDSSD